MRNGKEEESENQSPSPPTEPTPCDRFAAVVRKVVSVPKSEYDLAERRYRKRKAKQRLAKT